MKLELTEKDLFLLKLAVSVLLIFLLVRFLIMPQLEHRQELQIQLEELALTRQEMEDAIASIPSLKGSVETRLEALASVSEPYYEVIENRQIDEILTGLALEKGLFPISLSIEQAQPELPDAYLYSSQPENPQPVWENYVLTARGTMNLRGDTANIYQFMDAVEKQYPSIQIRSMNMTERTYLDVDWRITEQSEVSFLVAVYMCDREAAENFEIREE